MKKRGQATIFVILGILLVLVVVFLLLLQGDVIETFFGGEEVTEISAEQLQSFKNVVMDCDANYLGKAISFVSIQGGWFDPPDYEEVSGYDIGYACKDEVNKLPLYDAILREIEEYSDANVAELEECIEGGFDALESEGYDVSSRDLSLGELDSDTEGYLYRKVNMEVAVEKGSVKDEFSEVLTSIWSNLGDVYGVAVEVVNLECGGVCESEWCDDYGFDIADFIWYDDRNLAKIENGPASAGYQPWYLTSVKQEENGEFLRFHFLIE